MMEYQHEGICGPQYTVEDNSVLLVINLHYANIVVCLGLDCTASLKLIYICYNLVFPMFIMFPLHVECILIW